MGDKKTNDLYGWNEPEIMELFYQRTGDKTIPDSYLFSASITPEEIKDKIRILRTNLMRKTICTTNENLEKIEKEKALNKDFNSFCIENDINFSNIYDTDLKKLREILHEKDQSCLFEAGVKFLNNFFKEDESTFERIFDTMVFGIRINQQVIYH